MKKDIFSILCMTIVCATVMLGVMSIYKYVSPLSGKRGNVGRAGFAFEITALGSERII